jgi:hypothetical protein
MPQRVRQAGAIGIGKQRLEMIPLSAVDPDFCRQNVRRRAGEGPCLTDAARKTLSRRVVRGALAA